MRSLGCKIGRPQGRQRPGRLPRGTSNPSSGTQSHGHSPREPQPQADPWPIGEIPRRDRDARGVDGGDGRPLAGLPDAGRRDRAGVLLGLLARLPSGAPRRLALGRRPA
ncbi:MAG: hypothetical protein ACK55Z_30690, partial [bacterium]